MTNTYTMPDGDIELGDFPARQRDDFLYLVWAVTDVCNFRCPYCVSPAWRSGNTKDLIEFIGLRKTIKGFDQIRNTSRKKILVSMTGGEPGLVRQIPELVRELNDRGIYVNYTSNFICQNTKRMIEWCNPDFMAMIEAAYHWPILDENFLLRKIYIDNFRLAIDKGITTVLKYVASPKVMKDLDRRIANLENLLPGAIFLIQPYIEGYAYPKAYSPEEREMFMKVARTRRNSAQAFWHGAGAFKGMLCSAGDTYAYMNQRGRIFRCYGLSSTEEAEIGNIKEGVKLQDKPVRCPAESCGCSQIGLWYGFTPWDYMDISKKKKIEIEKTAYWNKYGPESGIALEYK